MKKLVAILLVSLMASSAFALADEGTNSLGLYLDLTGDNNCHEGGQIGFGAPAWLYVILANPTMPEVNAYEFGWATGDLGIFPEGAVVLYLASVSAGSGPIDVADPPVALGGRQAIVGLAAPMPTSPATVLHQLQILHLAPGNPFSVALEGVTELVPLVNDNQAGVLVPCELSTGGPGIPVFTANTGSCVVATESDTWGGVKSLYR